MGTKQLVYQEEARRALDRGINIVADAVNTTCICFKGYINTSAEITLHDIKTGCLCNN